MAENESNQRKDLIIERTLVNPTAKALEDNTSADLLADPIPYRLGKYEIKTELGQGTCGIVYRGFDPFVRRDVAIKVGWSDPAEKKDQNKPKLDFFTEAHAAGKLQHPNIVSVYDAQMEKDLSYIVMEYVEGETLAEYCRAGGKRLPVIKVVECIYKCCEALDFSHSYGVIHRDIKPSNIMLSDTGETKLMDFSVAEITRGRPISPSMVVGSPMYMSPEQVLQEEVGPQSDLYSLATVMFQLLTGKRLFDGQSIREVMRKIVKDTPPRLAEVKPDLPKLLCDIVDKTLNKKPSERFQSGKEMAAALATAYDNLSYANQHINCARIESIISDLPFFAGFDHHQRQEILSVCTALNLKAQNTITKSEDIAKSYYILVRGEAKVEKSGKAVALLKQGDCFGEIGASPLGNNNTAVITHIDSIVIKMDISRLETLSHETQLLFYKSFCENLVLRLASPRRVERSSLQP